MSKGSRPGHAALALVVALFAACAEDGAPPVAAPSEPTAPGVRPNVVLIVVDDLDFPSEAVLPQLDGLLAQNGVRFSRAFSTASICNPSRASLLTGLYTHNHGALQNQASQPNGGFPAFRHREGSTLATWLHAAGYRTALIGKYLNSYPWGAADTYVPPGWDEWFGILNAYGTKRYWGYSVNDNGRVVRYGFSPAEYSTDVMAERAEDFVRRAADGTGPFFLYVAPEAPHRPMLYAERHGADFQYQLAPRPPSFNEGDVSDKPAFVRKSPLLTPADIDLLDHAQRFRLRSMRAVEELVAGLLATLSQTGQLGRTWIFFLSDQGWLMGQHRAAMAKRSLYEEVIRIPLLVRGPGAAQGRVRDELVSIVDLAPTILDLAGIDPPEEPDGASLVPLLTGEPRPDDWRRDVLIEFWEPDLSAALRTEEWAYVEYSSDEQELYDMRSDPYQLENQYRVADPAFIDEMARRLRQLLDCRGANCLSP